MLLANFRQVCGYRGVHAGLTSSRAVRTAWRSIAAAWSPLGSTMMTWARSSTSTCAASNVHSTTRRSSGPVERQRRWLQSLMLLRLGGFASCARNPREDRRLATRLWLETVDHLVVASDAVAERARELAALGFGPLDALHLAFAEQSAARWFVTTDDRLLKRAGSHRQWLRVEVVRADQVPLETGGDHA